MISYIAWVAFGVCIVWLLSGLIAGLVLTYFDWRDFNDKEHLKDGIYNSFKYSILGFIIVILAVTEIREKLASGKR